MAVVTDTGLYPGGGLTGYKSGTRVDVYLVASATDSAAGAYSSDGTHDVTFFDKYTKYADSLGSVSFDLWPNNDPAVMLPANTFYWWDVHLNDGRVWRRAIRVPNTAGPFWVNDLVIAAPDPLQAAFGPATQDIIRTTAQTISNDTLTVVTFTASVYRNSDTALWDGATKLIAPVDGEYLMGGTPRFMSSGVGIRGFYLKINNSFTLTADEGRLGSASTAATCSLTGFRHLSAGDFLEMWVYQNSGGNLNLDDSGFNDFNRMWMKRIG